MLSKWRTALRGLCALLPVGLFLGSAAIATAQDGPTGIAHPVVFPPFNPNAPVCSVPPGMGKAMAFAQDNSREFMQGVAHGLALAAENRGLSYRVLLAEND